MTVTRRAVTGVSRIACLVAACTSLVPGMSAKAASGWTTVAPMPTARASLAAATGADGRIYAIGGSNGTHLTTVEAYTTATDTWTSAASMPTGRNSLAVATATDGRVVAIGGWNGGVLNTVELYTPSSDSWTTGAAMPTARDGLAAVTGPDGRIYAMGGHDGFGDVLSTVEAYTPSTNSWATVASMPTPRADFAAALGPDNRIYVVGGVDSSTDTSSVLAYTTATNSWASVASLPTLRYGLAAASGPDGRIYAIGGFGGPGALNIVEAYSASSNTWATVAPMPTARYGLAGATGPDGRIYAMGGNTYLDTVETYDTGFSSAKTTATTLASSANPSAAGQGVTYVATVAPTPDGGSLAFTDNGSTISGCAAVAVDTTTGSAPCSTSYTASGTHNIVATYSGDTAYATSSASMTQRVNSPTTYQESDVAAFFDGWTGTLDPSASGGAYRSSSAKGGTASLHFTGSSVAWITRKGPDQGIASVTIDGVTRGSFDLYSLTPHDQVSELFSALSSAAHTVVIRVTGGKDTASTGSSVAVDAFVVGPKTTQESSTSVTYDKWVGKSSPSAGGGAYRVNGQAGASCGLTFTGTSVEWVTATGPAYGEAAVLIDGVSEGTVDLYSATVHWQVVEAYQGLASGTHTLVVKALGTKNASSTGIKIVVDAFVVW